ncbi:phosphoadenosine phosphosulfate reductase family protein [Paenibacillus xylanexedens]|uniref:phosphoadenosine phosphosulfate reductase domain-containing protein n=1 Tax=Paenibacillus xylanexedens TaxID=528191 RepID=UPI0016437DF7|nr:phosphoadenosine phosphosulfate reductase family protein [Paenibacillus xylanexedens]
MPKRNYKEWREAIRLAGLARRLPPILAVKILDSLKRMPEPEDGKDIIVSFSGGKDSQVTLILAIMRYGVEKIVGLFADTHDEWDDTYEFIPEYERWTGVKINWADSPGIHPLLRGEVMGSTKRIAAYWPKPGRRHCTKNLKLLPQRDWMDAQGYGQNRINSTATKTRDGMPYEMLRLSPQMLSGERWSESQNRAELPFDERDGELLRWTHRPVLDWNWIEIWDFIYWMQSPVNPVYLKGIKRVACAGCIFASPTELYTLGQYHPDKFEEWVTTEDVIGIPRNKSVDMHKIKAKLIENGEYGCYSETKHLTSAIT